MTAPPTLRIPEDIRVELAKHGPELIAKVEAFLEGAPRPCVAVTSERVATAPQRRSLLGGLIGGPTAEPTLGALVSKFGGRPYRERGDGHAFEGVRFICQINLADVPPVSGAPREGLFALDIDWREGGYRVRWYPHPTAASADDVASTPTPLGKWEARMRFASSWSLPGGDAWHAPLPADESLWELWSEWEPPGFVDGEGGHVLFGHRAAGLDEHYGIETGPGLSPDIGDYEQVFRLTYDNQADFGIGTNWFHVMTPVRDYERGDLSNAIVVGANY